MDHGERSRADRADADETLEARIRRNLPAIRERMIEWVAQVAVERYLQRHAGAAANVIDHANAAR